jgi:hypothetical protein
MEAAAHTDRRMRYNNLFTIFASCWFDVAMVYVYEGIFVQLKMKLGCFAYPPVRLNNGMEADGKRAKPPFSPFSDISCNSFLEVYKNETSERWQVNYFKYLPFKSRFSKYLHERATSDIKRLSF